MRVKSYICLFLAVFFSCVHLHAEDSDSCPSKAEEAKSQEKDKKPDDCDACKEDHEKAKDPEPPPIGNFSLPQSQQPSALFGVGGNIIDAGEVQFFLFADDFIGRRTSITDVLPFVVFGVTDKWSFIFAFPLSPYKKSNCFTSRGLQDFVIETEYSFYNRSSCYYTDQATILLGVSLPTGSFRKNPATGYGAPAFILGGTFTRMYMDWFFFLADVAVLPMCNHGNKAGDSFLYQFGFGRSLPSPCGWIYAWMLEVDGQYSKKNRIRCRTDHNSGGNTIFVTPSVWVSSRDLIMQFGVSLPVNQNLFGRQGKFDYVLNFDLSWSIY